jgi:hypothetical protein
MSPKKLAFPAGRIDNLIREIRGHRVMLDSDLAAIYGVEAKALNRAVKRNRDRFPKDFAFQLTRQESEALRYQFWHLKDGPRRTSQVSAMGFHGTCQASGLSISLENSATDG